MPSPSLLPTIAPGERGRLIGAALGYACVTSAALVSRAAGDALFLSAVGAAFLPFMYIGSALILALVSYVYGVGVGRFTVARLTAATAALLLLATLGLRLALADPDPLFRIAAYFLADLTVNLPILLFWGFAALLFDLREGKRLFGLLGSVGTAACIGSGFLVRPFAARFGPENLLLLVALLLLGFIVAVLVLAARESGRLKPQVRERPLPGARKVGYYAGLLRFPQVRNLAALMVVMTLSLVVVDFLFKSAARAAYQGAALAGFFGSFYGYANVAALVLQLFLVHRVLARGGLLVTLSALPLALAATATGTAFSGAFAWVVAAKFVDPLLNFTLNNVGLQLLYVGIQKQTRSAARAFVEGVCKPLAMAAAGAALVALTARVIPVRALAGGVAVIAVVWLVLARRNYGAYLTGLIDSVGARTLEVGDAGAALRSPGLATSIRATLLGAADDEVPYLAHFLPEQGELDLSDEFRELLARPSPVVKVAALDYLRAHGRPADLPAVVACLEHPAAAVRIAAVRAVCRLGDEELPALERALADPEPVVRAEAAAELMDVGDVDGFLTAGAVLREMLRSPEAAVRVAATDVLEHVRLGKLTRLLRRLLDDPDREVRLSALHLAQKRPIPELAPDIARRLADPTVGPAAADALAVFGAEVWPELARAWGQALAADDVPALGLIASVLARSGDVRAIPLLLRALHEADVEARAAAIAGYRRFVSDTVRPAPAELDAPLQREILEAAARRADAHLTAALPGAQLLGLVLEERYRQHLGNAFGLLALRSRGVDMDALYFRLTRGQGEQRAQALEVLDNVLDVTSRSRLLRLLEAEAGVAAEPAEAIRLVAEAAADGRGEWLVSAALYAVAEAGLADSLGAVRRRLDDPSPAVRETALYACARLDPDRRRRAGAIARLVADPDPRVRALAAELGAAGQGASTRP